MYFLISKKEHPVHFSRGFCVCGQLIWHRQKETGPDFGEQCHLSVAVVFDLAASPVLCRPSLTGMHQGSLSPAARMPAFTQALGHISHFPAQGKRCSERSCSFAFKHYLKYFCYSRSQNFYYLKNRWRVGDRRFGCLGRFSFRNFFSICNLVVTLLVSSSFPSSGWPMFSSLLGGVLLLLTWE